MKHAPPGPPELGTHDGLAYALFLPDDQPQVGVVILHGAGSAKESHFDFARLCRDSGLAALAYDARGHGRSEGEFGPGAFEDALAMCELLRGHAPAVAALDPTIAAVVAICPAPEDRLLRGLRSGELTDFAVDRHAVEPWLESLDIYEAVARLGPDTALLLLHARGDEQIPYTISEELYEAAHEPQRL